VNSVPCFVCDPENIIIEDYSLAENTIRENLHPLDEFNAYKAMSDNGLSNDEIAARHFVSVSYVRQRLGLAAVAPELLKLFAKDEMTLAQVQALTLDPDLVRRQPIMIQSVIPSNPFEHLQISADQPVARVSD